MNLFYLHSLFKHEMSQCEKVKYLLILKIVEVFLIIISIILYWNGNMLHLVFISCYNRKLNIRKIFYRTLQFFSNISFHIFRTRMHFIQSLVILSLNTVKKTSHIVCFTKFPQSYSFIYFSLKRKININLKLHFCYMRIYVFVINCLFCASLMLYSVQYFAKQSKIFLRCEYF